MQCIVQRYVSLDGDMQVIKDLAFLSGPCIIAWSFGSAAVLLCIRA